MGGLKDLGKELPTSSGTADGQSTESPCKLSACSLEGYKMVSAILDEEVDRAFYGDKVIDKINKKTKNKADKSTKNSTAVHCCPKLVPWEIREAGRDYKLEITDNSSKKLGNEVYSKNQEKKLTRCEIAENIKQTKTQHHLYVLLPEKGKKREISVDYNLIHTGDCKHSMTARNKSRNQLKILGGIGKQETEFSIDEFGNIVDIKKPSDNSDSISILKKKIKALKNAIEIIKRVNRRTFDVNRGYRNDASFLKKAGVTPDCFMEVSQDKIKVINEQIATLKKALNLQKDFQKKYDKLADKIAKNETKIKIFEKIISNADKEKQKELENEISKIMEEIAGVQKDNESRNKWFPKTTAEKEAKRKNLIKKRYLFESALAQKLEIQKKLKKELLELNYERPDSLFSILKMLINPSHENGEEIIVRPTGIGACPITPVASIYTFPHIKIGTESSIEIKLSKEDGGEVKVVVEGKVKAEIGNKEFSYAWEASKKDSKKDSVRPVSKPEIINMIERIGKLYKPEKRDLTSVTKVNQKLSKELKVFGWEIEGSCKFSFLGLENQEINNDYKIETVGKFKLEIKLTPKISIDIVVVLLRIMARFPLAWPFWALIYWLHGTDSISIELFIDGEFSYNGVFKTGAVGEKDHNCTCDLKLGIEMKASLTINTVESAYMYTAKAKAEAEWTWTINKERKDGNKVDFFEGGFNGITLSFMAYRKAIAKNDSESKQIPGEDKKKINIKKIAEGKYTFWERSEIKVPEKDKLSKTSILDALFKPQQETGGKR